jgi:hypothetical protein
MKSLSKFLLVLAPLSMLAAPREAIESVRLDDRVVYTVPVATNRVTTINFPGPIAAIDAAGVTADPKMAGQFQIAHTKGSAFFSVKALAAKSSANVNVRWGKSTYVFQLEESPQPVLSLILEAKPTASGVKPAPIVSPTRLLALLDKAKSFPLLKQQHPEAVASVDVITFEKKPSVSDFNEYEIRIEEAFRFNPEDTLVLHLLLKNKTDTPIHYRPDRISLRVGNRVYAQSISDAAGLIPPKGEATAYFAVTGTPEGGRNELSLKNEFTVLVERLAIPPAPASTNQPPSGP